MGVARIEEGHQTHIKGFIMYKLYWGCYFAKPGKKHHGKHMNIKSLPKGYRNQHRGKFPKLIEDLRKEGLILVFPSCGEHHVCAVLDSDLVDIGLQLANVYLQSVGLPLLPDKLGLIFKKK